ncbi:MAG: DUF2071 domain-containing protein [Catalinimonas sp.]
MKQPFVFLRARWRYLIMANWEVPPKLLMPHLPPGTQIDLYDGRAYVSLVGFLFEGARLLGVPAPFHQRFEEFNLRFYVTHQAGAERRRGVVFYQELVPKPMIPLVANNLFGERYATLPMRHQINRTAEALRVQYDWNTRDRWHTFGVEADGEARAVAAGTLEEFITEHYWGYARTKDGTGTYEYQVEHPRWQGYPVRDFQTDADFSALYGDRFARYLAGAPASVYLLHGSEARIRWRRALPVEAVVKA